MAFPAEQLRHLLHAEPFADRVFDQLARPFNADDLHRPAAVLVRRHVDERQPQAARGDAVAVEQAGVEREEQIRRGRQHDAHVHVALYRDRRPQFALRNDDLADEAVDHPLELRQVGVGAELLGDLEDFRLRHRLMQIVELVQRISHHANPVQDPFVERKPLVWICNDLRIPLMRQAALQFRVNVARLNRIKILQSGTHSFAHMDTVIRIILDRTNHLTHLVHSGVGIRTGHHSGVTKVTTSA